MTLTAKQEAFCQAIASGMNQSDAYRSAYSAGKMKSESVNVNASKLCADTKVALRIAELKQSLSEKSEWTRLDSVTALRKVIDDTEAKGAEITGAVKVLNEMHGFNAPTKHELSVSFPRVINIISGRT